MELRGRPALVTGAAKRIGRAIALALADEGARVGVHCHRSRPEAEETVRLIQSRGGKATLVEGDLTAPDAPRMIVSQVREALGGLSVLVNSASIFEGEAWPISEASWDRHLAVNLTAPMRLIREATPLLRESRGAVINLVDAAWNRPTWREHTAYLVSKAGLAALTQNLARTLAPEVRVNGVGPGAVLPPDAYSESQREAAIRNVPLARWGTEEDVAQAVVFLACNDYITGQIVAIDGGRAAV